MEIRQIHFVLFRRCLAFVLMAWMGVGLGCMRKSPEISLHLVPSEQTKPSATPLAVGKERWLIENADSVGGQKPQVLGEPKVISDATGKAVEFDGVKDGLILPMVPLAGMKAFTLEVLFKPEMGGPAAQRFIHSEDEAGNRMTMETRLTTDGQWSLDTFLLAGANRLVLLDETKLHPANEWYWVALRYDGTTMTSFINAVKEMEGPVAFPPMGATGRISLGVRLNRVSWFKGMIREVRVTPDALAEGKLQRVK